MNIHGRLINCAASSIVPLWKPSRCFSYYCGSLAGNLTGHDAAPRHPATNYHLRSLTGYVDTNTAISDALLYSNDPIHEERLMKLIGFLPRVHHNHSTSDCDGFLSEAKLMKRRRLFELQARHVSRWLNKLYYCLQNMHGHRRRRWRNAGECLCFVLFVQKSRNNETATGRRDGGGKHWYWAASCAEAPDGWFIPASSLTTERTSRPLLPPSITITSSIWDPVSKLSSRSPNTHRILLLDRDLHPPTNTFPSFKTHTGGKRVMRAPTPPPLPPTLPPHIPPPPHTHTQGMCKGHSETRHGVKLFP